VASNSKLALKALDPTLPSERWALSQKPCLIQNTWTHRAESAKHLERQH